MIAKVTTISTNLNDTVMAKPTIRAPGAAMQKPFSMKLPGITNNPKQPKLSKAAIIQESIITGIMTSLI